MAISIHSNKPTYLPVARLRKAFARRSSRCGAAGRTGARDAGGARRDTGALVCHGGHGAPRVVESWASSRRRGSGPAAARGAGRPRSPHPSGSSAGGQCVCRIQAFTGHSERSEETSTGVQIESPRSPRTDGAQCSSGRITHNGTRPVYRPSSSTTPHRGQPGTPRAALGGACQPQRATCPWFLAQRCVLCGWVHSRGHHDGVMARA